MCTVHRDCTCDTPAPLLSLDDFVGFQITDSNARVME